MDGKYIGMHELTKGNIWKSKYRELLEAIWQSKGKVWSNFDGEVAISQISCSSYCDFDKVVYTSVNRIGGLVKNILKNFDLYSKYIYMHELAKRNIWKSMCREMR